MLLNLYFYKPLACTSSKTKVTSAVQQCILQCQLCFLSYTLWYIVKCSHVYTAFTLTLRLNIYVQLIVNTHL